MATASKTWVFATNSESLSQQVGGGTAPAFAYEGTDGNPAGSVKFTQGTKNITNGLCEAYNGTTGATFASHFGISSDATITAVRITKLEDRVVANTKLSSHQLQVLLIDDSNLTIATLATINPGTATGAWADIGAQASQAIAKTGANGCRLKLSYLCTTSGGGGSASVDYRVDNIAIEVTYSNNQTVNAGSGSGTFSGLSPQILTPRQASPGVGALTFTGFVPTVSAADNKTVSPGVGSVSFTGFTTTIDITNNITVIVGLGDLSVTGFAPTIETPVYIQTSTGDFLATGFEPAISTPVSVFSDLGSILFSGFSPDVAATQHIYVSSDTGLIVFTGYSPQVDTASSVSVTTDTGIGVLNGFSPQVSTPINVSSDTGLLSFVGFEPSLTVASGVQPGTGSFSVFGFSPQANTTDHKTIQPLLGELSVNGFNPSIGVSVSVNTGLGAFVLYGFSPSISTSLELPSIAESNTYQSISLRTTYRTKAAINPVLSQTEEISYPSDSSRRVYKTSVSDL